MMKERFELTLEALAGDIPATARLRFALKVLLRGYRLKCLSIRPVTTDPVTDVNHTESRESADEQQNKA